MNRGSRIESIRRRRAFERSWKGVVVSWLLLLVFLPIYAALFGLSAIAIRWNLDRGGWHAVVGAIAAVGGIFLWLQFCSPLYLLPRVYRHAMRQAAERRTCRCAAKA